MQSGDKRGQDGQDGQDRNLIWKGKDAGRGGRHFGRTGDANLALVPGMEVSLFLSTRMHDNKIYNEVLYKSLKVLS